MLTIKLNIKSCSDFDYIHQKQKNYSHAFRILYKYYNNISNPDFIDSISNKFNLNQIETRSLIAEVKTRFNQTTINKKELEENIINNQNKLNNLKLELNNNNDKYSKNVLRRKIFKLNNKINLQNKRLSKDIVFGGYDLLKEISFLSNDKINNEILINQKLDEYRSKRLRSFYLLGESNRKGNRFFDFDFKNKKIIYKPNRNKKIEILFSNYSTYKKDLLSLQEIINNKDIAITIYLSTDSISIIFDDEKLHGYSIDEKERKIKINEETKHIKNKEEKTKIIKEIYKEFYNKQRDRKLSNKLNYRYLAIDTNPDYIGGCILDKSDNKEGFKVITTFYYDLTEINKKLPKSVSVIERKRINNKKRHGISHIWKDIFNKFNYYKCGYIVLEELKIKNKDLENKIANRKINNVWHRELSNQLIGKYCNKLGIIKVEINPVYTSFIGNLLHNYIDPINASIEIGRRGIYKYIKNTGFYPELDMGTILDTVKRFNRDVKSKDVLNIKDQGSWNNLYRLIKTTRLRYRANLDDCNKLFRLVHNIDHSKIRNYQLIS